MPITRMRMMVILLTIVALIIAGSISAQQINQQTKTALPSAIPEVARPLPLSAVRLTGGPLKHAQQLDADYLLKLEPDRMMAFYRKRAGLEPKAEPYGGWTVTQKPDGSYWRALPGPP